MDCISASQFRHTNMRIFSSFSVWFKRKLGIFKATSIKIIYVWQFLICSLNEPIVPGKRPKNREKYLRNTELSSCATTLGSDLSGNSSWDHPAPPQHSLHLIALDWRRLLYQFCFTRLVSYIQNLSALLTSSVCSHTLFNNFEACPKLALFVIVLGPKHIYLIYKCINNYNNFELVSSDSHSRHACWWWWLISRDEQLYKRSQGT